MCKNYVCVCVCVRDYVFVVRVLCVLNKMHSCAFGHVLSYNILGLCVHDWTAKRLTGLMRYLLCNSLVFLIGFSLYCVFMLGLLVEREAWGAGTRSSFSYGELLGAGSAELGPLEGEEEDVGLRV